MPPPNTFHLAHWRQYAPRHSAGTRGALAAISDAPAAILTSTTDADAATPRSAARHAELAATAGIVFGWLQPTDWNDLIRQVRKP